MNILQRINQTDKSQFIYHANRETAQKLGFRYVPFEPDGPVETVDAILGACELNEEVSVYIDENGIINPDGPDWTKAVGELLGDRAAAFAADVGSERERWNINGLCASQGIFAPIKNGDEDGALLKFLTDWRAAVEAQMIIRNDRLTVQRALNAVWPKWRGAVVKIDDYYRFAGRYGALIRQTYLDGAETVSAYLTALFGPAPVSEPKTAQKTEPKKTRKRTKKADE